MALGLLLVCAALCVAAPPSNLETILEIAQGAPDFSTLVAVAAKAGLAPLLSAPGLKTVFAPNNEAFAALGDSTLAWLTNDRNQQHLLATLYYHFTPGTLLVADLRRLSAPLNTYDQGPKGPETVRVAASNTQVRVNNAKIFIEDLVASNGAIQAIDRVLLPRNFGLPLNDTVATAKSVPSLSILVKLLVAAGLTDILSLPNGPYTVFAPLDSAFAVVPSSILTCLLNNTASLRAVLLSHVISGLTYSTDIPLDGVSVPALSGLKLRLGVTSNTVVINYGTQSSPLVTVVQPDVDTSNGAVHVIDKVIFDISGPCSQL